MSSDPSNFIIEEYPSSKPQKKSFHPLPSTTKSQKLPEKDKKFIEELKKGQKDLRTLPIPIPANPNPKKNFSVTKEKSRRTKNLSKHVTSSDFKESSLAESISQPTLSVLSSTALIDKKNLLDMSFKYFVGPGNNDGLVKRTLAEIPGWIKAFTPHSANLIWTEVKQFGIFELIPVEKRNKAEDGKNKGTGLENCEISDRLKFKLYNKVEGNKELCSKKKLFQNMVAYYKTIGENAFKYLPLTFHVVDGVKDPSFADFTKKFNEIQKDMQKDPLLNNCWVVKPGEATNRGIGITVCSTIDEVSKVVEEKKTPKKMQRTYILQKYLYRPMLYLNRKFDIRCYALITFLDSKVTAYFYREGYLRTSCQEFNMDNINNRFIHLTNDAVQKYSPDYGRFEDGNKLSYVEFQEYVNRSQTEKIDFKESILPKIRKIVQDTFKATHKKLDIKRRKYSFEIFGYDFMLDEMFNPWLLEVNTNPCLALSGKYLTQLIPQMLKDAFSIILPSLFPTGTSISEFNKFDQIFSFKRN